VSKYAVLSEADFAHECSPDAWTVSTAARFAQPSRLVWSADEAAAESMVEIVSMAAPTLLDWTMPVLREISYPSDLWIEAFSRTFNAELRAERLNRAVALVQSDEGRYESFGLAALQGLATKHGVGPAGEVPMIRSRAQAESWWRRKQAKGKLYSVARLAKASLTFAGGADYIAWKINRHAGTDIQLKPWQQRHPLLAAITLLPRLLRSGAVR